MVRYLKRSVGYVFLKQTTVQLYSFCRDYNLTKWQNNKVDVKRRGPFMRDLSSMVGQIKIIVLLNTLLNEQVWNIP